MPIDRALLIASSRIAKILDGQQKWEIRAGPIGLTGRIALAVKPPPSLVATCRIGSSIRVRAADFRRDEIIVDDNERASVERLLALSADKAIYAWRLGDVRPLTPPIAYLPRDNDGASWIMLTRDNVPEFDRLQASAAAGAMTTTPTSGTTITVDGDGDGQARKQAEHGDGHDGGDGHKKQPDGQARKKPRDGHDGSD